VHLFHSRQYCAGCAGTATYGLYTKYVDTRLKKGRQLASRKIAGNDDANLKKKLFFHGYTNCRIKIVF
jgi:hypothetical protein